MKWKSISHVWLFATPWSIQSMEFSRPEYWSGEPFHSPVDLPDPGIKPGSPALQADSLPTELSGKKYLALAFIAVNGSYWVFYKNKPSTKNHNFYQIRKKDSCTHIKKECSWNGILARSYMPFCNLFSFWWKEGLQSLKYTHMLQACLKFKCRNLWTNFHMN